MTSPAFGLAQHYWQRYRVYAITFLAYGAMLAISVPVIVRLHLNAVALVAAMPLEIALASSIALFANSEADIVGKNSGYPSHLLILPVRTTELVLWPMLYSVATVVGSWLALGHLILHPLGVSLPLWWPALIFAGLGACVPAVFWLPLGLPYLRMGLLLAIIGLVIALGVRGAVLFAPGILVALYLGVIAVAYLTAVYGVASARRGDTPEWFVRTERAGSALQVRRPFVSPQQAQFRYEWSRNGILVPLFIGSILLFILSFLLRSPDRVPLDIFHMLVPADHKLTGVAGIQVYTGVKLGIVFGLGVTPILAGPLGCGVWRPDNRKRDHSLNLFYATRPLTSAAMVLAKYKMAACSTLVAWGLVLLFEAVLLVAPAQDGHTVAPLGLLLLHYVTLKSCFLIAMVLLAAIVMTWKGQVSALFVDLAGRPWITNTYPVVQALLMTGSIMVCILLSTQHPEMWPRVLSALPYAIFGAVLVKLLVAGWALQRCGQRHLIPAQTVTKIGIGWLCGAFAFWAVLCCLLSCDLRTAGALLCSVLLFLPLARISLAPLAMDWNRHR